MTEEPTWPDVPEVSSSDRTGHPTGWRRLVATALVVAWVAGFTAFVVWCRARTFTLGYQIARATAEGQHLLDEQSSLELERTSLRSPLRVGPATAGRMGLRPPRQDEVVRLLPTGGPERPE